MVCKVNRPLSLNARLPSIVHALLSPRHCCSVPVRRATSVPAPRETGALPIGALTRTGHGNLGPVLVPAWIGAAYFFTSSTSFANPAVTIGRSLTDTFAGIAPASVPMFIVFQIVGATIGALLTEFFYPRRGVIPEPLDLPGPIHHGPHNP